MDKLITKREVIEILKKENIQYSYQGNSKTFYINKELSIETSSILRVTKFDFEVDEKHVEKVIGKGFNGLIRKLRQLRRTGVHKTREKLYYITRKGNTLATYTPKPE